MADDQATDAPKPTPALLSPQAVKVGWLGMEWRGWVREIRMAFEEAVENGLLDRPYEFVFEANAGLPQGTAQAGVEAFRRLVDAGCIAIVGANYTDSAVVVAEHVNAAKVPTISMCGTDQFHGEYCFRVGNGDVGGDPTLMVNWLARNGYRRPAVIAPWSPIGEEYFSFFRQECRRHGLTVAAIESVNAATTTEDLVTKFMILRDSNCDSLAWLGFGGLFVKDAVRPALSEIGWDPPRIMTTAFMQYPSGYEKFEGWVGIDQWCPLNPRLDEFVARFAARYGEEPTHNALPGLAYDMARVVVEGLHRAPILSGPGVKKGIERIRFMPAVTGGPNTHIAGGPYDHQLFKGDWLHFGRVRDGKLEFEGLFEASGH